MNKYAMAIIKIPIEFLQDGSVKQYPDLYQLEMVPIESLPPTQDVPQNNIFESFLSNIIPCEDSGENLDSRPSPNKVISFVKTFKNHVKPIRNYTQKRRPSSNEVVVADSNLLPTEQAIKPEDDR